MKSVVEEMKYYHHLMMIQILCNSNSCASGSDSTNYDGTVEFVLDLINDNVGAGVVPQIMNLVLITIEF